MSFPDNIEEELLVGIPWEMSSPAAHGRVSLEASQICLVQLAHTVVDDLTLDEEMKLEAHVKYGHLPIEHFNIWTLV